MKTGTKAQVFDSGEFDDHGKTIEVRGREAVVRWHVSGTATPCADLVIEEWNLGDAPENPVAAVLVAYADRSRES